MGISYLHYPSNPGPVGPTAWQRARFRADEFRLWLATSCCACLSSVPSFALVIIAAVLIMLLVSAIPLAFVLTRMRSEPIKADANEEARQDGEINVCRDWNFSKIG